jgi:hypothetical protein
VASGILPDGEGGHPAARKKAAKFLRLSKIPSGLAVRAVFSAGLPVLRSSLLRRVEKPRLYGRQDARRYGAGERDLQVASMCERRRRAVSVWTLKRRERRAPPTNCAARNYFTFSSTSISTGSPWSRSATTGN